MLVGMGRGYGRYVVTYGLGIDMCMGGGCSLVGQVLGTWHGRGRSQSHAIHDGDGHGLVCGVGVVCGWVVGMGVWCGWVGVVWCMGSGWVVCMGVWCGCDGL